MSGLNPSEDAVVRLQEARFHDPFSILGRHGDGDRAVVRAFLPRVERVEIAGVDRPMVRLAGDLFEWEGAQGALPFPYRLRTRADDQTREFVDPYQFGPQLAESDLASFNRGDHYRAHAFLGAHPRTVDGVSGVVFATWAPNAERVSVIGDFNQWDGRCHPMRARGDSGVWELFLPGADPGTLYKFEIRNRETGEILVKSDPYARRAEVRPRTASIVVETSSFEWGDAVWLERRRGWEWGREPISIYELHLGSWDRPASGEFPNYREIAGRLIPYLLETGFTHVELLPITEHPYDGSWGYQTTGYFAPTSRYGSPDDLRYLVDGLHQNGIGVFLDWVPGHFPRDGHGLIRFDGSALYEYDDTQKGEHAEWGTLVFNYARREVLSFLISSALYWIDEFHFDGLRVDAVAAMLYLDYSRPEGGWAPNEFGGNENLEAIDFLKALNTAIHGQFPGAAVMAEESTAWPGVTRPTYDGGLGFTMKWNMGWMHDTLEYLGHDPVYRKYHHDLLSFGPVYVFTENFVSPLSHDEVVHGKGSLLGKMAGDDWQQFANLRLLYTFQWTYPGKKLLFMGSEFAQREEWDSNRAIRWDLLDEPWHAGIRRLVEDLNRLYRSRPALFRTDFQSDGFVWLRWDDRENSVLSFIRRSEDRHLVVVLNFTPMPRQGYRIGIPQQGVYREIINTDSRFYGGTDVGNPSPICSEPSRWMDQPFSMPVTLPPLGGIILERE